MSDYKDKILAFRKIVPIPISKAKAFLAARNWDLAIAIEDFKNEKIVELFIEIGEDIKLIEQVYIAFKYDYIKTKIYFKYKKEDEAFDLSRLEGLTEESFKIIYNWAKWENEEGLLSALKMDKIGVFIAILRKNLELHLLAERVELTSQFLAEYNFNEISLEQQNKLKKTPVFIALYDQIELDKINFSEQLNLVRRNFLKRKD